MSEENFIDFIKIYCRSGDGGAGSVHFRREKFIPRGGPDGGDGGKGGDIILIGNRNLWTLLHLRYTKHVIAGNGEPGRGKKQKGADGESRFIEVPLGTVVKEAETGKIIAEIVKHGEQVILLEGGRGGKGNEFFKTATRQTPRFAQPGEPGKEGYFIFELKILADVGLVGFPNAGKSTLLSVLTAAKPKIADYPFTTLVPNIGIVQYKEFLSFVMADIPGIIEGAHQGKGLGLRFLRHIERNSILLFLIPCTSEDIQKEYEILLNELKLYNPELLHKDRVLAISKCDLLTVQQLQIIAHRYAHLEPVFISSVSGYGLETLKDVLWKKLTRSDI